MCVNELRKSFVECKKYEPEHHNELLDFAQQKYLKGNISISQYKSIVKELELIGAQKPDFVTVEEHH
ncbi:YppF family protein [Bacillus sp. CGMCC 1.16541]|uniref:YppF family protein n=1 Tax=Bacillus sp. CGMCC 1.16541 TaxID=2185143 RepID=UPI000D736D76|nr:YppF family protein [Bacillus sp. CGMCC 1.16541]